MEFFYNANNNGKRYSHFQFHFFAREATSFSLFGSFFFLACNFFKHPHCKCSPKPRLSNRNISNLFPILGSARETWLGSARRKIALFCSTSIHHAAKLMIVDFNKCRSMCIGLEVLNFSLEERVMYSEASVVLIFICFPLNLFECSRWSSIANSTFSRMSLSEYAIFEDRP